MGPPSGYDHITSKPAVYQPFKGTPKPKLKEPFKSGMEGDILEAYGSMDAEEAGPLKEP